MIESGSSLSRTLLDLSSALSDDFYESEWTLFCDLWLCHRCSNRSLTLLLAEDHSWRDARAVWVEFLLTCMSKIDHLGYYSSLRIVPKWWILEIGRSGCLWQLRLISKLLKVCCASCNLYSVLRHLSLGSLFVKRWDLHFRVLVPALFAFATLLLELWRLITLRFLQLRSSFDDLRLKIDELAESSFMTWSVQVIAFLVLLRSSSKGYSLHI